MRVRVEKVDVLGWNKSDAGSNVCTPMHMMCMLNYSSSGYNHIVEVIKQDRIHLDDLIAEHNVDTKRPKNFSGRANEFDLSSYQNSIKLWS